MNTNGVKELAKKKSVKIGAAVVAVVVVGAVVVTQLQPNTAIAVSTQIQSAKAETGNITTSVTGTGNLKAADSVDITVPAGIEINEVKVSAGDTVTKGQTLATVTQESVASALTEVNTNLTAVSKKLSSSSLTSLQKEEYNAIYSKLTARKNALTTLHDTLAITATADGVIGTVNVSAGSTTTKSSSNSSSDSDSSKTSSDQSKTSAKANSVSTNLTATTETSTSSVTAEYAAANRTASYKVATISATKSSGDESDEDAIATASADEIQPIVVSDYENLVIPSPVTGETGISGIDAETTKDQGYEVTSITWDCNGAFQADSEYTATIELKALAGYTFSEENTPVLNCSAYDYKISGSGEMNRMTITAKYEKTTSDASSKEEKSTNDSQTNEEANSQAKTTGEEATDAESAEASYDGGTDVSGSVSGSVSSGSSDSSSSDSTTNSYETSEATAFTITTQENFKVSLSVDELDILSVQQGQSATITLNAVSGEEFEGTVTKVGTVGTTSGSSAKYTVEITVPKKDNMLIGMTASATINTSESNDAVLIPISALQEKNGKSFVYTSTDSDGNLSGKTEVETGLSNETQVEITSGLKSGDTVYYQTATTSSDSSSGDQIIMMDGSDGSDMGGGPSGDGGDMSGGPGGDGGSAPDGGGQGAN